MANVLYDPARQAFLEADLDWTGQDMRVILVDLADYTFSAAHQFLTSVPAGARVAVSGALTGKTATNGVADADDVTFTAVAGDQSEALVIYQHTGVDATSRLVAFIDTATGFPITPNGGNITVIWDSGANRIFKL